MTAISLRKGKGTWKEGILSLHADFLTELKENLDLIIRARNLIMNLPDTPSALTY